MRLALIGPSAPFRGGIAAYHDRLAAALAARGHAVARISFSRMYPRLLFPGRTQYVADAGAVTTARAGGGSSGAEPGAPEPLLDSLAPASWRRVAERVADMDAAVCEWWHPFFAPALATIARRLRRRGVPTVFICHNLEPHEPVPGGVLLSRLALRQAAGLVAQSGVDATRLRQSHPGRPVAVVLPPAEAPEPCPHGSDRAGCARALGVPPAARRALFFGYVRAYKGLPTLLEALAATPADVQLVVAGEIYHRDARFYAALAVRLGIAARLALLDRFVDTREVACCFNLADVVVLPYWAASQSAVAPLAMACGRAVVASAVGGLPDLVRSGETGLLVPPRDAPALAAAIERALVHAPAWGAAALQAARARTWEAAAATIEELVRAAVSTCGRAC
jgi:glycosyltransferase involved in cell wall biosynthesis